MKSNFQTLLTIKRLGINGEGIGYYKRKAVFVDGAIPEEEIICEFIKEEDNYIQGKVVKIKKPSKDRVETPCPYFGRCGGCQLQHIKYESQLKFKREIIVHSLERYLTKYDQLNIDIKEMIGMDKPYYYRNKAQMPVANEGRNVVTGLYEANTNHLVYIDTCIIQNEFINNTLDIIKVLLSKHHIMAYNRKTRSGNLRYVSVRYMENTKECQVVLVLKDKHMTNISKLAEELMTKVKEVVSFYVNINPDISSHEIYGEEFIHIRGKKTIEALIKDIKFTISPHSFYQLNTKQTEVLYDVVKQLANLKKTDKVIDSYCGIGTISLFIARDVAEVRGVDITEQAIKDARNNASLNNITNAYFEAGHAETIIPKWIKEGFKPDCIIMDPPRTGIDDKLLSVLKRVKVKKLIYVSCNPSTLAKDLNELTKVYNIEVIQPVDMFPQTSHVECVVLMSRVEK